MSAPDIVLLSTADWDNPFWTNKQHVAVSLAARGCRVLYIDSLGLRRPSISTRDLRRILRRLKKGIHPPRLVQKNIWVWSPILLPFNGIPVVRYINHLLLRCGLALWMRWLQMAGAWLWTYNPLTEQLLRLVAWPKVVYHCVDDIKAQPGMPVAVLEQAEGALVQQSDVVFVTSPTLEASRKALNPHTYYLSNVADYAHFSKALSSETTVPNDLNCISGYRIGFIGAISGYKVDFELLRAIAERRPEWSIVMIGEIGEGDPWTDSSVLNGVSNIHLLGPRPYSELPAYLKGFDVAMLPNKLNDYTASMFPMKFFEYLAAGRPVVSTLLPSLKAYEKEVHLARSVEDFINGISDAIDGRCSSLEERLALARQYTYDARMERMLDIVGAVAK